MALGQIGRGWREDARPRCVGRARNAWQVAGYLRHSGAQRVCAQRGRAQDAETSIRRVDGIAREGRARHHEEHLEEQGQRGEVGCRFIHYAPFGTCCLGRRFITTGLVCMAPARSNPGAGRLYSVLDTKVRPMSPPPVLCIAPVNICIKSRASALHSPTVERRGLSSSCVTLGDVCTLMHYGIAYPYALLSTAGIFVFCLFINSFLVYFFFDTTVRVTQRPVRLATQQASQEPRVRLIIISSRKALFRFFRQRRFYLGYRACCWCLPQQQQDKYVCTRNVIPGRDKIQPPFSQQCS